MKRLLFALLFCSSIALAACYDHHERIDDQTVTREKCSRMYVLRPNGDAIALTQCRTYFADGSYYQRESF